MSRRCQISKRGNQSGNSVSHANNKRRRTWNANLHMKRVFDSESGTWVRLRLSSRILRTIDKKGLSATLRDYGLKLADVK
jgi:large subunit ribosomal protein L28